MTIDVVELHHHGIRIGTSKDDVKKAKKFYGDVLGLEADPARPTIASIPGFWMYVGNEKNSTQIHLMGATGKSAVARSKKEDPTLPHVALAVRDIDAARRELKRRRIWHWSIQGLVAPDSEQIFVHDPFGNVIELHQVGTCTCNKVALKRPRRKAAAAPTAAKRPGSRKAAGARSGPSRMPNACCRPTRTSSSRPTSGNGAWISGGATGRRASRRWTTAAIIS